MAGPPGAGRGLSAAVPRPGARQPQPALLSVGPGRGSASFLGSARGSACRPSPLCPPRPCGVVSRVVWAAPSCLCLMTAARPVLMPMCESLPTQALLAPVPRNATERLGRVEALTVRGLSACLGWCPFPWTMKKGESQVVKCLVDDPSLKFPSCQLYLLKFYLIVIDANSSEKKKKKRRGCESCSEALRARLKLLTCISVALLAPPLASCGISFVDLVLTSSPLIFQW